MPDARLMCGTRQLPLFCELSRGGSDPSKKIAGAAIIHLFLVQTNGSCIFLFLNGEADEMAD